jgi:hypothetical protein
VCTAKISGPAPRALLLDARSTAIESCSLLRREQAAARQDERSHTEAANSLDLRRAVSDAPILAEDRQTLASAELEPLDVRHQLVSLAADLVMGAKRPARLT